MVSSDSLVVKKVIIYQAILVVVTATMFLLLGNLDKGVSAALGGMAAFIPNLYFALRVRRAVDKQAKKIVKSFYVAESGKLILTAALFAMIFQIPKLEILPLMLSYVVVLSVFWFALLMR